jgi:hypothetical protein
LTSLTGSTLAVMGCCLQWIDRDLSGPVAEMHAPDEFHESHVSPAFFCGNMGGYG